MAAFNPKFFIYPANIESVKPTKIVTMFEFLRMIKESEFGQTFKKIEEASKKGDMKLKATLKSHLVFATPCVITDGQGRAYSNIRGFTGLMPLDFDKLDSTKDAKDLKRYLFYNYPEIIAAFLSPSKLGVKCLVRIPISRNVDEYKSYFYGMASELEELQGFDVANQNAVLPLYISTDPDLLYKDTGYVWRTKGTKIDSIHSKAGVISTPPVDFKPSETAKKEIQEWVEERITGIYDNGHPQVLATATTLGGYVGWGYMSEWEANSLIDSAIDRTNYLQKGPSGYKRTAHNAIRYGAQRPLEWKSSSNKNERRIHRNKKKTYGKK